MEIKEEYKQIEEFPDYYISNYGNVISTKKGCVRALKPWKSSNGHYYQISLCKNGIIKKKDIHRLVAKYFVPNPNNYPVVNHLNHDTYDNYYGNLEWTTTQMNIHHSYSTMGPARNKRKCKLILLDGREVVFDSYPDLLKYKRDHNLDFSDTGLRYHGKSRGYRFERM